MSAYLTNSFHMGVSHVIQTIHLHNKVLKLMNWIFGFYPLEGFLELWNPAIRIGEHGEDGKHQPDDLKHSIYD